MSLETSLTVPGRQPTASGPQAALTFLLNVPRGKSGEW